MNEERVLIHLDARTGYSFMRGFGSPEAWLDRCHETGATAIGIADYASTWGHIPFRNAFSDVKLIYGVQIPVCKRLEKDPRHGLVTVLAKNNEGLAGIYRLLSLAHEQTYYRPRVTWKQIEDLKNNIELIVNECSLGDLIDFERLGFGYIGISPRQSHMHRAIDDFQCVATGSPVYPRVSDREAFDLVQAISNGMRIGEAENRGFHLMKRPEYEASLRRIGIEPREEWFKNAEKIASECEASIEQASLPRIEGDLRAMAIEGARSRGIELVGEYSKRLKYELKIVEEKGFDAYFLFVSDLVEWSKRRMLVGPARGSAGGSLLCFFLGITEVDPLVHGTLFERFLDPTRSDYPDIDVDFPDKSRDEVFRYLSDKYGENHVARLGTVTKFGGKSAINDTCKAFGTPFAVQRDVSKEYVDGGLYDFFSSLPDHLKPILETYPYISKARLIDGAPRHTGVHAAGVCITADDIHKYGCTDKNGVISLDLKSAEDAGMLKMDALGLRTLSVLSDACEQIDMNPLELYNLPLDDENVFAVFNRDIVTGVFQFEGNAVRGLMNKMNVSRFNDLCALTSLARPGPLIGGAAENYVQRRSGSIEWDYVHPLMREHTEETYGTIVYQEQAMSIVRNIADFDIAEVNRFRKAVGKKDPVALAGFRDKFVRIAGEKIGQEIADDLWDEMCEFGSYAFNKSHAVAYSMISYYCAWFKAYHPVEFALAQLRNAADDDQAKSLLRELEKEGHKFVSFDPHQSEENWSIQNGVLTGGFTSVKGVGKKTAQKMIEIREQSGAAWLVQLTEAQRKKLLSDFNTPWHDLNRFSRLYHEIYNDPLAYRSKALRKGARGPIYRIEQIPCEKGAYTFLGRLIRRQPREKTDANGNIIGEFCNLFFEDDTGQVGCTISRKKWPMFKWLLEDDYDGHDFIVKGADINGDGRKWLFIENMIQLDEDDRRPSYEH